MRKLMICAALISCSCALPTLAQETPVPPDSAQLTREGVALYDAGHLEEAIAKYRQALAADPKNATASYELGLTLAAKGDYAGCRTTIEPIVSIEGPLQVQALVMLGNCLDT